MNVNELIVLGTIFAVLLAGVIWIGLELRRSAQKQELTHQSTSAEANELRNALAVLQAQVSGIKQPAPQPQQQTSRFLTADQRAEALSMLRGGAGTDMVRTTLRLPWAETTLLQKVETLLATTGSNK